MKKRCLSVVLTAVLLFGGIFSLSACSRADAEESVSTAVPVFPPLPAAEGLRIAVASDLHFYPELRPDPDEPNATGYSPELIDAMLWDVRQQGAKVLLLTGDLCNNGEKSRHEGLTEMLRRSEENGLSVYVLPGNHDLGPITQTEFAELYADFGYAEAFSRDSASLSYCVIRDDLMILMMDTAGYGASSIELSDEPLSGPDSAFLTETTLRWVEQMLREAEKRKLHVLAAGHYNLFPEISRDPESTGYYLRNGDRFKTLLCSFKVPLYLSGHMHVRAVYQEDGLTELLTEFLLAYPVAYSVLDLTDTEIVYTPRRIDVDAWASETGQTDPILLHFAQWQQDELYRYSMQNVGYMAQRNPLNSRQKQQTAEFFYRSMDSYWRGTMYEDQETLKSMPGRELFFRCSEGYAYGWWLQSLLETASPLMRGFSLKW